MVAIKYPARRAGEHVAIQRSRWTVAVATIVLVVGSVVLPGFATGASAATSTNFYEAGFNAAHTDYNNHEDTLSAENVSQLHELWSYQEGGTHATPIVYNGDVVTPNGITHSLQASTGDVVWNDNEAANDNYASAAAGGGLIYLASDTTSAESVSAERASSGKLVWQTPIPTTVANALAVVSGVVYVGGTNGVLYAFDASTGAVKWQFTTGNGKAIQTSAAVYDGRVYFGAADHDLYSVDTASGSLVWKHDTGGSMSSPAVVDGRVIVGSANRDSQVQAYDANTGALLWQTSPTSNHYQEYTAPAVANGVVYIGATTRRIYAFRASTGKRLWTFTVSDYVESAPVVAGGVVFEGADNGHLYALDGSSGTQLWSFDDADWDVYASPSVVNGQVFVTYANGDLFAFGLPQ